ncbi:mycothiol synthase [Kitasatospora kifunensis]|uniref:Mycothiol acetyltransferase n=1 Tax=Kitasatospora kifunensis TaxID=58351 RepID=A0A7W7VVB2_KITKI|nr:mycothiol synthase [Kitasatospora kifunensis]MBB4924207.1 mycothiol synthase [Kitasatospora kifunensis]
MDTAKTPESEIPEPEIHVTAGLSTAQLDTAQAVLRAAAAADGREAVSEAGRLRLRVDEPREGVRHLVAGTVEAPAGYGQLELQKESATAELAVHPDHRGHGLGRALVGAVLAEAGDDRTVDFWAHGGHPAARRLAEAYGAELVRELRQMRRTGPAPAEVSLPEGVTLRTFRPGVDDEAWLRLNALAFAHHPEQGSWTARDLTDRIAEPWFDPAGFFLAVRGAGTGGSGTDSAGTGGSGTGGSDTDGERLVGFHWTKVHPATATEPELGEVYVVGVDPAEQGNGLGKALTAAGLRHLAADRGLATVLLYVDADNAAAVRVYERVGFTVHEVDLMYRVTEGRRAR